MDYSELAMELMNCMMSVCRIKPHRHMEEALHGEGFLLGYIAHRGGSAQPGELGQHMRVSTARVAAALNNLEKKGLISRQIDPNNRRQILVSITQDGRELTDRLQRHVLEDTARMLEFLGERDAKEYVRIMGRLAQFRPDRE